MHSHGVLRRIFSSIFSYTGRHLGLFLLIVAMLGGSVRAAPKQVPEKVPDLYNLGPIGGKAVIARDNLPQGATIGLRISVLADRGIGRRAGLRVEDTIWGTGGTAFVRDPYLELAAAIDKAQYASDAAQQTCSLSIQRGGETQSIQVTLVPLAAVDASGIPASETVTLLSDAALAYLAREQSEDGSYPCTISETNGQVALTSLAGLAFLAGGHTAEQGSYQKQVLAAARYVMEFVGVQKRFLKLNGKNTNQTNWSLGYGGIFLAELYHATDAKAKKKGPLAKLKGKLKWISERILANMEASGGFAAGPGGPNLLDYVELEIMSNLCLAALGCIEQCGITLDRARVDKAIAWVERCDDGRGGIRYRPDLPPGDVCRTAGALNAFASLGRHEHPLYAKMESYLRTNVAHAFEGHSTPTMHILSTAIAAKRDGNETWAAYWKAMGPEMTMLRNADNSFSYRPTADTLRMGVNLDRDLRDTWTTAHWALVLGLSRGGLKLWSGALRTAKPATETKQK